MLRLYLTTVCLWNQTGLAYHLPKIICCPVSAFSNRLYSLHLSGGLQKHTGPVISGQRLTCSSRVVPVQNLIVRSAFIKLQLEGYVYGRDILTCSLSTTTEQRSFKADWQSNRQKCLCKWHTSRFLLASSSPPRGCEQLLYRDCLCPSGMLMLQFPYMLSKLRPGNAKDNQQTYVKFKQRKEWSERLLAS